MEPFRPSRCFQWIANWKIAAVALVCALGCGTVTNLDDHARVPEYYGGVRQDWQAGTELFRQPGANPDSGFGRVARFGTAACILAVDMPLSAIADTVTLPVVATSR